LPTPGSASAAASTPTIQPTRGPPLSYNVEALAADDDDLDLDPAAAALSKSRQWVLTALRAGGDLQTVKELGDRLAQAGTRSSLAPSRPPWASWRWRGWRRGARKAMAGPATGHRPPPIRMPTAPATVKGAMVGERAWHDRLASSWIEASPNPPMEPGMVRWVALSPLTCERHQGESLRAQRITTRTRRPLGDAVGVVEVTDAVLGAVAGVAVGSLWSTAEPVAGG
jgi:hypothetical protein